LLVRNLATLAEKDGKPELLQLWAGQSASLSCHNDAKTLLQTLVSEVSVVAGPLLSWNRERGNNPLKLLGAEGTHGVGSRGFERGDVAR
jgi:hypothetical protein